MENIQENIETVGQESQAEGVENTTYTEAQVQELLQKEADRRVSQALAKQQQKWEYKMAEAEKLRSMDEAQRKEYEFESKMKEFEEQKREFALTQNKLQATQVLANRNLPVAFVDYIVAEDADTMLKNIETFERAFKSAVNDAVSKKIATPTPKMAGAVQTGMTKDQFSRLSLFEQANIATSNPELYKEMTR